LSMSIANNYVASCRKAQAHVHFQQLYFTMKES
jgi:hypothetical protein